MLIKARFLYDERKELMIEQWKKLSNIECESTSS